MLITMLRTQTGSRDGVLVELFRHGAEYDLTRTEGERELALVFVREGWARPKVETAALAAAPENKAHKRR